MANSKFMMASALLVALLVSEQLKGNIPLTCY